jgi:hypothetical protein
LPTLSFLTGGVLMSFPWQEVGCVRIAVEDLRVLADLRGRAEVRVSVVGDQAWVFWKPGTDPMPEILVNRLLPLPGVEMYVQRGGNWHRPGASLPAFGVPTGEEAEGTPLERIVLPRPMTPLSPSGRSLCPVSLRLVRQTRGRPRPARGLWCALTGLAAWAEDVPTERLAALRAAWTGGSSNRADDPEVIVLGSARTLPELPDGVRCWGSDRLLVPLGFRPEPELPEAALCRALGAGPDDLVVLHGEEPELIPRGAFRSLSRAAIRLAGRSRAAGARQP